MLADSTLAQYRSELRSTSDHVEWLTSSDSPRKSSEAVRRFVVPMAQLAHCAGHGLPLISSVLEPAPLISSERSQIW